MRILLYSQHVLGIGHFFRSMEIARALHRHEVLFVEGGDPLPGYVSPSHVTRMGLPSLMMDAEFSAVHAGKGAGQEDDVEALKARRSRLLMEAFRRFRPDVFMTELFPFGRKAFRFELMPVLKVIRDDGLPTRVVCSLRDILVEKRDQEAYEEGVLRVLNEHYHLLLVHADPRVIALEDTFERFDRIAVPVHYTGFVVRQDAVREAPCGEKREDVSRGEANLFTIVASSGGGKVGADLLFAAIRAVKLLARGNVRLRVFIGPFMEEADRLLLADAAAEDPRISVEPFSLHFTEVLREASLSISMAGYNTCMDILNTGVNALVYPFPQNREQAMRAHRLEELGRLRVIRSLEAKDLASLIESTLAPTSSAPLHRRALELNGAARTAQLIADELKHP